MFQTVFIEPLYNTFVFLIGIMPQGDVGLAIIALTAIIRIVFYPAFAASIRTQMGMQAAQPVLDEINKKYKDDTQERTKRTMQVFKERGIKPFSSLLSLFVQIPIFIALYLAFFREGLPEINGELLYSFVQAPESVNTMFLGVLDLLSPHNIALVIVVGGLQYLVAHFSILRMPQRELPPERAAAHKMQQYVMLYFLPILMAVFSYYLPAGVGLYFAASSLISLAQEWIIRRQITPTL